MDACLRSASRISTKVWDCTGRVVAEATTTEHLGSHPDPVDFRKGVPAVADAVHLDLGMSVWKYMISAKPDRLSWATDLVATTSQNCGLTSWRFASVTGEIDRPVDGGGDDAGPAGFFRGDRRRGGEADSGDQGLPRKAKAGWKVNDLRRSPWLPRSVAARPNSSSFAAWGGPHGQHRQLTPFTVARNPPRATVLWSRSTENRIRRCCAAEGGMVQDAETLREAGRGVLFHRNLPPRIPKPEISKQVGRSILKDGKWQDSSLADGCSARRRPEVLISPAGRSENHSRPTPRRHR